MTENDFVIAILQYPPPVYSIDFKNSSIQKTKTDGAKKRKRESNLRKSIILNINYGYNQEILEACAPLRDYTKFIHYVRMKQQKGLPLRDAVDTAIDRAVEEHLLEDYFQKHKAEVRDMFLTEYDEEKSHRGWYQDGLEEGFAKGERQGLEQGEDNLADLLSRLVAAGRTADAEKVLADKEYRKKLYKEFGIA
mgnify:CR=1 FL=1